MIVICPNISNNSLHDNDCDDHVSIMIMMKITINSQRYVRGYLARKHQPVRSVIMPSMTLLPLLTDAKRIQVGREGCTLFSFDASCYFYYYLFKIQSDIKYWRETRGKTHRSKEEAATLHAKVPPVLIYHHKYSITP